MFVKNENKVLLLKLNTCANDSNGIYDYTISSNKNLQTFIIQQTYFVRTKNNIYLNRNNHADIKFEEGEEDLIFYIKNETKDNYILINFIKKNLELNDANFNYINNKIWYVLKTTDLDNRDNDINCNEEYFLNENDIIKIGRLKYAVQKIHLLNKNNNVNEDAPAIPIVENNYNISDLNKNTNPVFQNVYLVKNFKGYIDIDEKNKNVEEMEIKECKYCHLLKKNEETDDGENFLISVCKCSELVHFKCLKYYIQSLKDVVDENDINIDESMVFKNYECPECKNEYPTKFKLSNNNKIFNLIDIKEPEDCNYMILESIDYKQNDQYYKSIHIIKFIKESGEPITIGRENGNDIIDRDISMSRQHAILRFDKDKGKISIQNWKSKYGTLILIKKPIKILNKKIYLQVGRTFIEACLTNIEEYNKIREEQNKNQIKDENDGKQNNKKENEIIDEENEDDK